jgi:aminoglycoside 3'-phosphotransferase-2
MPTLFLKIAADVDAVELIAEHDRLRWLAGRVPVECPFDRTLEQVLPAARARAMAGRVDDADFHVERLGYTAIELLGPLYQERPEFEDIVVTHGDACLPNAIFDDGPSGGNFAAEFFGACEIDSVDAEKVSYYQLVDEFF